MSSRPLRVLIDARMLLGRFSGISRYVTRLVDALAAQDGTEVVTLCAAGARNPWIDRNDVETLVCSFGRADRVSSRRVEWDALYLRRVIQDSGCDLFHATWNSGVPALCPVPAVLTIHDLIPWRRPKNHFATTWQRRCYRYAIKASARRARRILTVSDHVGKQIIGELAVPVGKVTTIYHGVDPTAPDDPKATRTAYRYLLYVGGHEPRKNLAGLFCAMQAYWNRHSDRLRLHVTGTREMLDPSGERAFASLTHRNRVVFLGNIDDRELTHQYTGSSATISLSLDEGFGLPMLEAMGHGSPVVAANRGSLPEVVGSAGMLVDPDNTDEVVAAIRRATVASDARQELIERGRARAERFTWTRTAEQVRTAYAEVCVRPFVVEVARRAAWSGA